MTERMSTYALDRARAAGESPDDERVRAMRDADRAFLARFPDRASLNARRRSGRPFVVGGLAVLAVTVALVLVPRDAVRSKGAASAVEMYVERGGVAERFVDQRLREGDTLVFRYSTEHTYLLGVGLEASGAVQAIIVGADGRSVPIPRGERRVAPTGVRLDDYPGPERIFVLLSDAPLDARRIEAAIAERFATLPADEVERLSIDPLSLEASVEARSWLIRKQAP